MSTTTGSIINLVFQRKCLYSPRDPDHKSRQTREKAWREIGSELGLSVQEAKVKWTSIRDRYKKEKREAQYTSGLPKKRRTWEHYKSLWFLDDEISEHNSLTNEDLESYTPQVVYADDSAMDAGEDLTNGNDDGHLQNIDTLLARHNRMEENVQILHQKDPILEKLVQVLASTSQLVDVLASEHSDGYNNSDKHFVLSLLGCLSRLPSRKKEEAKIAILTLLMKTEFEESA